MRLPAISTSRWSINSDGYVYRSTGRVGIDTDSPGGLLGLSDSLTYLDVDVAGNLTFTDTNSGTKTLSSLSQGSVTVKDYGATGDGTTNDGPYIQAAIDSGKQVIFPEGTYRWSGTITFDNHYQRANFLSGAKLDPLDASSKILMTGSYQTVYGMCIITNTASTLLLDIQAGDSLMYDLRIEASKAIKVVNISNLTKFKFIGGSIKGTSGAIKTVGSIGLNLETTAYEPGAYGLTIHHFETGIYFEGNSDDPTFVNCNFENNTKYGIHVNPTIASAIYNFNLMGCHFEGSEKNISIETNGNILGGMIHGCRFGSNTDRIFEIIGTMSAVTINGCFFRGNNATWETDDIYVWDISGIVQNCIDSCNYWDYVLISTGGNADKLTLMSTTTGTFSIQSRDINLLSSDVTIAGNIVNKDLSSTISSIRKDLDGYQTQLTNENTKELSHYNAISGAIQTIRKDLDGYQTQLTNEDTKELSHYNAISTAIQTIRKDCDGYAVLPSSAGSRGDGYISFFCGSQATGAVQIGGDDDLHWNRVNEQLHIGAATPALLTTQKNSLYVSGLIDCGSGIWTPSLLLGDNGYIRFGTGTDCLLSYATVNTPDTLQLTVSSDSGALLIIREAYRGLSIDYAHPKQSDPTIFLQSGSTNIDEWIGISHNKTNGYITTGKGGITLDPAGQNVNIDGYVYDANIALRLGKTGLTSHSLLTGDVIIPGKLEVDEATYLDGDVFVSGTQFKIDEFTGVKSAIQTIRKDCDGYAVLSPAASRSDGYVAFFTGTGNTIAGDNDLKWDRVNNRLVVGQGGISLPNGTNALSPAISFTADSDTGFWAAGVGEMRFVCGGTQILLINTGGFTLGNSFNCNSFKMYDSGQAMQLGNTGATSHGLLTGDVIVPNKFEVDGTTWFDGDVFVSGTQFKIDEFTGVKSAIQTIRKDLDGYQTQLTNENTKELSHYNAISTAIQTIRKDCDGYAALPPAAGDRGDGYIAFFCGSQATGAVQIGGDNDLYWDRRYNQLKIGSIVGGPDKISTTTNSVYIQGRLEVDSALYADGPFVCGTFMDCNAGRFGSTVANTGFGIMPNDIYSGCYRVFISTYANRNSSHGLSGVSTDPEFYIFSGIGGAETQNFNQYMMFTHNRTNGYITTGTGGITLDPAGQNVNIDGYVYDANGALRLGKTGTTTHGLVTGDVIIPGKLEVDDSVFLDSASISMPTLGDYANDGLAAAGGVAVGGLYRNGSIVMVRVA